MGLNIDDITYRSIYLILEHEISRLRLFKSSLNTLNNKDQLTKMFRELVARFPYVFDNILVPWKSRCLTVLAQGCNSNKRRQAVIKNIKAERTGFFNSRLSLVEYIISTESAPLFGDIRSIRTTSDRQQKVRILSARIFFR
jgi:hypothetical protein